MVRKNINKLGNYKELTVNGKKIEENRKQTGTKAQIPRGS